MNKISRRSFVSNLKIKSSGSGIGNKGLRLKVDFSQDNAQNFNIFMSQVLFIIV